MRKCAHLAVGSLMSVALLLNGCAADTEQAANTAETSVQTLIEAHDLAGMDAVEMIDHLDRVPMEERPTDLLAAVMPDQLVLASATEEVALELPEDAFYLSIAPFVNQTHECHYHSLTTCVGELSNQEVKLTVSDASGEVLVKEQSTTFDNDIDGVCDSDGSTRYLDLNYDGSQRTP